MKIYTFSFFMALILSLLSIDQAYAQRVYATTQQSGNAGICVGCAVTNAGNAVDGNPQTSSSITVTLGIGAQTYQEAIFPAPVAANTPVFLKLGSGDNLLSAGILGGISLQAYNGATTVGPAVTAATLVTALNNNDQVELRIAPAGTYDRVRVTLDAGLIGALSTIYLYEAYYKGNAAVACNTPVDELHGISSALLGLGLGVGGVANPANSIDGNLNTAATLNAGVGLLGSYAQQTILYNSASVVGDSIAVTLSMPQALVDAGVTSNITIRTFNGTTNNNDVIALNSNLLSVRLLDLSNNRRRVRVAFAPQNIFDRVQVRLAGGIAAVLSSIDLHEVQKTIPAPAITINGSASTNAQICSGATATFTVAAIPNTTITWYTAASGGSPIFTGNSFTTPALTSTTTYYAQASRNGCTDGSTRVAVTATVNPIPAAPGFASTTLTVNPGATPTISVSNPQAGLTYNWYTAPSGGTPVFTGPSYTTPAITSTTTYYVDAVSSSCTSGNRTLITINVNVAPDISVNPPSLAVNPGQTGTFTATSTTPGATFNWYTTPSGGSPVFTGPSFTTPAVSSDITYYAEATNPSTNLVSARASISITVNGTPDVTVTPPAASVNAGQSTTFTASSNTSGVNFNWYTSASGGTPIFTGPSFTTPPLSTGITYYAEAVDSTTNATSPRASATVNINGIPDLNVTPPMASVNAGQSATFTATSTVTGTVFNWYTDSLSTQPIFTGPIFTSPAVFSNTTFYAQATDPATNATSARVPVVVQINGTPDITITPSVRNVNPGESTTFTATSSSSGVIFNWYTSAAGNNPIFSGSTFTTPAINANTTYYAQATDPATNATSARATASVTVNGLPTIAITPPVRSINAGQSTTFTATSDTDGAIFNWYTASSGGSPIFTGPTFTTPVVNSNVTFYASAVDPATNATSALVPASVTVNGTPDIVVTPPSRSINPGETTTFTASSSTSGVTFSWYTSTSGGTPIFTGPVFTTPSIYAGTAYYVEAVNSGTNATSQRASATVTINGSPNLSITPPTVNVNAGGTATFTATSTTSGTIFNWYSDPVSTQPIFTGPIFTSPGLYSNTTFYAQATDPSTNATSPKIPASVSINGVPDITVNPSVRNVNPGESTTFTATSNSPGMIFNWYATEEGTVPIFSGATFTTPGISANTTYYAEAIDPATNATSPRATASVTVNGLPTIVITPPVRSVNAGQTTTFTASSDATGAIFNWYTDASGGSPVFTGPTFTTPVINSNITFYASAVDPATNAASERMPASVTVNGMPDIVVTPPSRSINAGETTTFTASSTTAGAVFNWYADPSGGTAIFTGATYTTPALYTHTTYYVSAVDPSTSASSARIAAYVDIANAPDLTVTPPVANVDPGETATFNASSTSPDVTFNWYTEPVGGTPVFTGPDFTTPPVTSSVTYYAEATDPTTSAVSERVDAVIVVIGAPTVTVTPEVANVNEGKTATFTASSNNPDAIFKWYASETSTTPLFTGPVFTTPAVTGNATYYAEAVDPATNATSVRTAAAVTVNPAPSLAVTPPTQAVNAGQTATFTATSTTPGAIFNWYSSATATTPIFTGAVFKTPVINGTTEFYAESVNPLSGAASPRFKAEVTLNAGNPLVFIPNAFSPNGDGRNDQLILFGATITNFDMRVFNQWGQLIFHSNDYSKGWDGTWRGVEQPVGVYVYYVRGTTGDATQINQKGTVTLIR